MGRTSGDSGWPESAPPLLALAPFPLVVVVTSLEEEPLGGVSGKWTPAKIKKGKEKLYLLLYYYLWEMHRWEKEESCIFPRSFRGLFLIEWMGGWWCGKKKKEEGQNCTFPHQVSSDKGR